MGEKIEKRKLNIKLAAIVFSAIVILVCGGIIAAMLLLPYDPGTLSPASLSSNLNYGGTVSYTDDYIFLRDSDGNLGRITIEDGSFEVIYTGDVHYINPLDGWVYFVDGGRIMRTAYYGMLDEQIAEVSDCAAMSVNGSWIYYTDTAGRLFKIRNDGKKQSKLSADSARITSFTADNRVVVYQDDEGLHKISTDGKDRQTLAAGEIGHFCYTLDDIYYEASGVIQKIPSVVSGVDVGLAYTPVQGKIFCYNTNASGRSQIFYWDGETLHRTLLESESERSEEDEVLCTVSDMTDLYSIDGSLYFHDSQNRLFCVTVNGSDSSVKEVVLA